MCNLLGNAEYCWLVGWPLKTYYAYCFGSLVVSKWMAGCNCVHENSNFEFSELR